MDQQLYVLHLFFDLTKVYDVINHEILLNKLEYYGIRGTIKAWIEFYLIHRNLLKYLKLITEEETNSYISLHVRKQNTDSLWNQFWGHFCFYYLYE